MYRTSGVNKRCGSKIASAASLKFAFPSPKGCLVGSGTYTIEKQLPVNIPRRKLFQVTLRLFKML